LPAHFARNKLLALAKRYGHITVGQPVSGVLATAPRAGINAYLCSNVKGLECKDWFFCTKKIDKDEILGKVLGKSSVSS
jgi:hypothetical protein